MPQMIVQHEVKDYKKWIILFEAASPLRKLNGEKSCKIFRSTEDPNDITILFDWDNAQKALRYAESDELRAAMKQAGVIGDPVLYLLNEETYSE